MHYLPFLVIIAINAAPTEEQSDSGGKSNLDNVKNEIQDLLKRLQDAMDKVNLINYFCD